MSDEPQLQDLQRRIQAPESKARAAEHYVATCNLQAAYGYYVDKTVYDEAADLFARQARLEIAGRGLFVGRERVRQYVHALPKLEFGCVFNHMQLQPVISSEADGSSARGRWRNFIQIGWLGREARWGEGTYENVYVREDGVEDPVPALLHDLLSGVRQGLEPRWRAAGRTATGHGA